MAVGWGPDRLCQTRLIPRSPDGDNKWKLACGMIYLICALFAFKYNAPSSQVFFMPKRAVLVHGNEKGSDLTGGRMLR